MYLVPRRTIVYWNVPYQVQGQQRGKYSLLRIYRTTICVEYPRDENNWEKNTYFPTHSFITQFLQDVKIIPLFAIHKETTNDVISSDDDTLHYW